jgi:chromosome segregation ATPase
MDFSDFEPFAPLEIKKRKGENLSEEDLLREKIKQQEEFIEKQRKEIRALKEELEKNKFAYRAQIKRLQEEINRLTAKLSQLTNENTQLKEALNQAIQTVENLKEENQTLKKGYKNLLKNCEAKFLNLRSQMLIAMEKILLTVLAEILKEEKIFKEENIKNFFRSIFEDKIFLGELTIKASPQDVGLIKEILKENPKIIFDIKEDPSLKRGEFEIETPKFFVERKYEEIIPPRIRELIQQWMHQNDLNSTSQ